MNRTDTGCCALTQLRAGNHHTVTNITAAVNSAKKAGFKAAFIIQTPSETELAKKLPKAGFFQAAQFGRRKGQGPGKLTMWFKQW